jgi:hypothetical protein
MSAAQQAIIDMDEKFNHRLTTLTNAMRTVRTAIGLKKSVSGVLRIMMSVDVARDQGQVLLQQYRDISRAHTARCFRYIGTMFILVKRYLKVTAEDRRNRIGLDPEQFSETTIQTKAAVREESLTGIPRCGQCGMPFGCYDCSHASSYPKSVLAVINQRRWHVMQFTQFRVEHFQKLIELLDQVGALLKKLRLIPNNWETLMEDSSTKPGVLGAAGVHVSSPAKAPPVSESQASRMIMDGLAKLQAFQNLGAPPTQELQRNNSFVAKAQSVGFVPEQADPSVEHVGVLIQSQQRKGTTALGSPRNVERVDPSGENAGVLTQSQKRKGTTVLHSPRIAPDAANRPQDELEEEPPRPHNGLASVGYFAELRKRKSNLQPNVLLDRGSALAEVSSARYTHNNSGTSARISRTEFVEDTLRTLDHFSPRKPVQLALKQRPHFLNELSDQAQKGPREKTLTQA